MLKDPLFSRQTMFVAVFATVCVVLIGMWLLEFGITDGRGIGAILVVVLAFTTVVEFVRQRFRFGLRIFLLTFTIVAALMAMFGNLFIEARQQRIAVEKILQLRGRVDYDYRDESAGWIRTNNGILLPRWLATTLGDDLFSRVYSADLDFSRIQDGDLEEVFSGMEHLEHLRLAGCAVTDSGLEHLTELTSLQSILLNGRQATTFGFRSLSQLPDLRFLALWGPSVTDETLVHLEQLPGLKAVSVAGNTSVTEAGVRKLREAMPGCVVNVGE